MASPVTLLRPLSCRPTTAGNDSTVISLVFLTLFLSLLLRKRSQGQMGSDDEPSSLAKRQRKMDETLDETIAEIVAVIDDVTKQLGPQSILPEHAPRLVGLHLFQRKDQLKIASLLETRQQNLKKKGTRSSFIASPIR